MKSIYQDPYEKAFGVINAYKNIDIEKRSKPVLKIIEKRIDEMQSIIHSLEDDVEYSESDISDNDSDNENINVSNKDSGERRDDGNKRPPPLPKNPPPVVSSVPYWITHASPEPNYHNIHKLPVKEEYKTHPRNRTYETPYGDPKHGQFVMYSGSNRPTTPENKTAIPDKDTPRTTLKAFLAVDDDTKTLLDKNIVKEYFDENYKPGKTADIILKKKSDEVVNEVYERQKLLKEGKEIPDDLISDVTRRIERATDINELKTTLKLLSNKLQHIENELANTTKYTVADLKNSVDHEGEGEGELNAIKEINEYDLVYIYYHAYEKIIKEIEEKMRTEKQKTLENEKNKIIRDKERQQEAADYGHLVSRIADKLSKADSFLYASWPLYKEPNESAYLTASEYVKRMAMPGKSNIDPQHINIIREALKTLGPTLISRYFDKEKLFNEKFIEDPSLINGLNILYSKMSKKPNGFTFNHDKTIQHIKNGRPGKGYLKPIWDD